ncbi:hypothetical protein AB0P05_43035 [Streptomyces flaveolus]|uniref:hypothetical protein n=1 Tax=Streptomyces flaveolus TaxID=67297 RepID=UPI00342D56F8
MVEPVVIPAAPARPEEYDTATQAALDHIDRQAVRTVADGRPESTRRSYAQDCASWTKFCADSGVPVLAVTPGTLVMFVEWLWTQPGGKKGPYIAPSTIDRRISGTVVTARAEHGVRLEDDVARLARNRLKQLVKEMEANGETRGRGQAPPLPVEHLVRISAACPDNLRGIGDRALVLMHFAVAGREHELAFNRVRHYAETPPASRPTCSSPRSAPASSRSPTAPGPPSARSAPGRRGRRRPVLPTRTVTPGVVCTTAGTPSWRAGCSPSPSATSSPAPTNAQESRSASPATAPAAASPHPPA